MSSAAKSAVQAYKNVSSILQSLGFTQSASAFGPVHEPRQPRTFRLRPESLAPSGTGRSMQVGLTLEVELQYQELPEDDVTVIEGMLLPDADKVIDALSAMQDFDPSQPMSVTVNTDEEGKFRSLSFTVRMAYCRQWTP